VTEAVRRRPGGRQSGGGQREQGSALVEFQVLAVLLLVPLVYVLLAALDVQRTVFGATQAAREAGRVAAVTGQESAARHAAALALRDQGVGGSAAAVTFTCPEGCRTPGAEITVRVATEVPLPYLPPVLADAVRAAIPVTAVHTAPIDRFRERP
jgi:Flp pilus assembly protein TadG